MNSSWQETCMEDVFLVAIKIGSPLAAQVVTVASCLSMAICHRLWIVCGTDLCFRESTSRNTVGGSFFYLPEIEAVTDTSPQIHTLSVRPFRWLIELIAGFESALWHVYYF